MIHTVYITSRITSKKLYEELFETLKNNSSYAHYPFYPDGDTLYKTHYLQDMGFNTILLRKLYPKEKYKRPFMQIEIFLNPKKLISDNHIKITKDKDILPIAEKFNEIIKVIHPELPDFIRWTLKRVDYATYINTPFVKEYIKLFQRSDRPSIHFDEQYDISSNRRKQKAGSFYLWSKGVAINFYDKRKERIDNQEKYNIPDTDIENAKNTLRFEIQCNKSRTDYMKVKYEFDLKFLYYFLNLNISRDTILYYYRKCIKEGDYYTLKDARKIVDDSSLTTQTKNNLKNTLDLINKCRSIHNARQVFIDTEQGKKDTFNRHIKKLIELNINPVTIPEKWRISFLENPVAQIEKRMTNTLE